MVWSHECSIIFVFYTSTCTAQLDYSTRFWSFSITTFPYHVGGVVIARQPKSPVMLFACNPKTTQQWRWSRRWYTCFTHFGFLSDSG